MHEPLHEFARVMPMGPGIAVYEAPCSCRNGTCTWLGIVMAQNLTQVNIGEEMRAPRLL